MAQSDYFGQGTYDVRCEWGPEGVRRLAGECDAMVIVDVLSFCTCVDVAVARGAVIYPFEMRGDEAAEYARSLGAVAASQSRGEGYTLSPASLIGIEAGTKLVLPSPNGASLSRLAAEKGAAVVLAGCLRNARAVAAAAREAGKRIGVVPAGERWRENGTLRPALEDLLGAGAIVHHLGGEKSPEARLAEVTFLGFAAEIQRVIRECVSGRELIDRGFGEDVEIASQVDESKAAPVLREGGYRGN